MPELRLIVPMPAPVAKQAKVCRRPSVKTMLADLPAVENVGTKDIFATRYERGTFVPALVAKQQCGAGNRCDYMFDFASRVTLAIVVAKRS